MECLITIRRAVAIILIAAFALAPLLRPAMAEMLAGSSAADVPTIAGHDAMVIADGMDGAMPCCPSKAPQPVDCDKCVLMAVCLSKCVTGLSDAPFEPVFLTIGSVLPPMSDFWPDGFGRPPLDHPPRLSI